MTYIALHDHDGRCIGVIRHDGKGILRDSREWPAFVAWNAQQEVPLHLGEKPPVRLDRHLARGGPSSA